MALIGVPARMDKQETRLMEMNGQGRGRCHARGALFLKRTFTLKLRETF